MASREYTGVWVQHGVELEAISDDVKKGIEAIFAKYPELLAADGSGIPVLAQLIEQLLKRHGAMASESAVRALITSRLYAQQTDLVAPVVADTIPLARIERKLDKYFAGSSFVLGEVFSRWTLNQARITVAQSAARAGTAWVRIPGIKACDFCLMLASRITGYTSKNAALYRKGGTSKYHDHCGCYAMEVYPKLGLRIEQAFLESENVPAITKQLHREWREVQTGWRDTGKTQMQLWREHVRRTRPNGETIPVDKK